MTPLQLEPSAHAPWTRTMFIRIYLRDQGNRCEIGLDSLSADGRTTAWMMVVNLVWVQPHWSPFSQRTDCPEGGSRAIGALLSPPTRWSGAWPVASPPRLVSAAAQRRDSHVDDRRYGL